MATLSITLSQLSPNVKAVHTGVVAVAAAQTLQAASSASSVFKLCQVPNGATLVDWWLSIGGSQAGQVLKLGTSQTPSGIMAATSLSLTLSISTQAAAPSQRGVFNQGYLRAPGAGDRMPVRVSLSDDAQPSNIWVHAKAAAAITVSMAFSFCLFYTMDGMAGRTTVR